MVDIEQYRNGTPPWGDAESVGKSVTPHFTKNQLQVLQKIMADYTPEQIESVTLAQPQIACPTVHTFGPGVYTRELSVPGRGTFLVGHKQRYEQLNIFLRGKVLMFSSSGSVRGISAPMMFTGGPGKKTGIVLEDMVWLNIFPSDETNIDTLEDTFFEKSEVWKNSSQRNVVDFQDYGFKGLLKELGMTQEQMDYESQNEEKQVECMPYGSYKCGVHRSPIHGRGIMVTANIYVGECIGPARVDDMKTPFGRYCNHSDCPNAYPYQSGDNIHLFAKQDMVGSFGGALGDEVLIDYREMEQFLS